MPEVIEVSDFGSVPTIVFLNKSHDPPTQYIWVCKNTAVYESSLAHLGTLPHVEIVQHGHVHAQMTHPCIRQRSSAA